MCIRDSKGTGGLGDAQLLMEVVGAHNQGADGEHNEHDHGHRTHGLLSKGEPLGKLHVFCALVLAAFEQLACLARQPISGSAEVSQRQRLAAGDLIHRLLVDGGEDGVQNTRDNGTDHHRRDSAHPCTGHGDCHGAGHVEEVVAGQEDKLEGSEAGQKQVDDKRAHNDVGHRGAVLSGRNGYH